MSSYRRSRKRGPTFEDNFSGHRYSSGGYSDGASRGSATVEKVYTHKFILSPPNESTSLTVTHNVDGEPVMYLRKGGSQWVGLKEGEWSDLLSVSGEILNKIKDCRDALKGKKPEKKGEFSLFTVVPPSAVTVRYKERMLKRAIRHRVAAATDDVSTEEESDDDTVILNA